MGTNVMHAKKMPLRQCVGCGERREKKELIRILRSPDEEILIDFSGKKNGRGAYICNSVACLKKAEKKKALERSLKVTIPEDVYRQLEKEMMESECGSGT